MATQPGHQPTSPSRRQTLTVLRLVWAAMLVCQLVLIFVIFMIWNTSASFQINPPLADFLFIVSMASLVILTPMGYFLRGQIYKRYWQREVVTPQGYLMGNVVLLVVCEATALLGLIATLVNGVWWPTMWPSLIAMAIQVVNWPHGLPMRANDPEHGPGHG